MQQCIQTTKQQTTFIIIMIYFIDFKSCGACFFIVKYNCCYPYWQIIFMPVYYIQGIIHYYMLLLLDTCHVLQASRIIGKSLHQLPSGAYHSYHIYKLQWAPRYYIQFVCVLSEIADAGWSGSFCFLDAAILFNNFLFQMYLRFEINKIFNYYYESGILMVHMLY